MLILPIVNRNRILNVEISLKNAKKIKTGVILENIRESDIIVDGAKYSTSVYNIHDGSENLVVDFIRNASIRNKNNYTITTREFSNSTNYDVYSVSQPPKKVTKELDDLYGSVITDMRKEIPNVKKGRYISFEKIGIDKHLTDEKISLLQTIVKEVKDQSRWPQLFKKAGIADLQETLDFVNAFDCTIISDTTISEDTMQAMLEVFKKMNTKDYKGLKNYYNIALSNKKIVNKLLYLNKIIYNKPLDLIHSNKEKQKVLVKVKEDYENERQEIA